jgi:hypothetical protein
LRVAPTDLGGVGTVAALSKVGADRCSNIVSVENAIDEWHVE